MLYALSKGKILFILSLPDVRQNLRKRGMNVAKILMNSLPAQFTPEELSELEDAEKMPIIFDDDCPEMTNDMLNQFHRIDKVAIRLSPSSMKKVKAFGPDYAKILSRLLDLALNDMELVKKCM